MSLLILLFFVGSAYSGDRWQPWCIHEGLHLLADTESITTTQEGIKVWLKVIPDREVASEWRRKMVSDGGDKFYATEYCLWETVFDIKKARLKPVQIVFYDERGTVLQRINRPNSEWQGNLPGSVGECLTEALENYQTESEGSKVPEEQDEVGAELVSGSGFLVSNDGYVVTNAHVVDNASAIRVLLAGNTGKNIYHAKVVQIDKSNDLAVLAIDDSSFSPRPVPPFSFRRSLVQSGEQVFTMGYPLVNYMGADVKVTDGIVSSASGYGGDVTSYQITAPIQHGCSGSPLFDRDGNVVGVINALMSADVVENVGYAIKSGYLLNLLEMLPTRTWEGSANRLKGLALPSQVRELQPYMALIFVLR
jgi:S1-C subfamily serine protease